MTTKILVAVHIEQQVLVTKLVITRKSFRRHVNMRRRKNFESPVSVQITEASVINVQFDQIEQVEIIRTLRKEHLAAVHYVEYPTDAITTLSDIRIRINNPRFVTVPPISRAKKILVKLPTRTSSDALCLKAVYTRIVEFFLPASCIFPMYLLYYYNKYILF